MYNPNYIPTTDFVPQPKVTVTEARTKALYHQKIIQKGGLTDEQLAFDYQQLNYYNQIILKHNKKNS